MLSLSLSLSLWPRLHQQDDGYSDDGQPASALGKLYKVHVPVHHNRSIEVEATLFDKDNNVITHLGYDQAWTDKVLDGFKVRREPETWQDGKFVHPHDACFDKDGNIFVAEGHCFIRWVGHAAHLGAIARSAKGVKGPCHAGASRSRNHRTRSGAIP